MLRSGAAPARGGEAVPRTEMVQCDHCGRRRIGPSNIRINQQFAVSSAAAREFLLGPFLVTAPLRRHLDHNPQSRFLRSGWLAFSSTLWARVTGR
jgi:hypothetical protein